MYVDNEQDYNYQLQASAEAEAQAQHEYEYHQFLDEISVSNPRLYAVYFAIDLLANNNKDKRFHDAIQFIIDYKNQIEKPAAQNNSIPEQLPF